MSDTLTTAERNSQLIDLISRNDKSAAEGLDDYVRRRLYERGFSREIFEYQKCTPDMLDKQLANEDSVKIFELEPELPTSSAYSVNYYTGPTQASFHANKFLVRFQRLQTTRMEKDIATLRGYSMDLRQVISDLLIRILEAKEDGKLIAVIDAMLGSWGSTCATTGSVQSLAIDGGITRETWVNSLKVLQRSQSHLSPDLILCNNVNTMDFVVFGRDEFGGDTAEQTLLNGFTQSELTGKRLKATIKGELVPENTMYQFAAQKYIGKFMYIQDTTMSIEAKDWLIKYYAWNETGCTVASAGGIARVKFTGSRGA